MFLKIIWAFVISWMSGFGHLRAITEKKADAMNDFLKELGVDLGSEKGIFLAKKLLMDVHGYANLVPLQMEYKAYGLKRKTSKLNRKIREREEMIKVLQMFVAYDKDAAVQLTAQMKKVLDKKELWG